MTAIADNGIMLTRRPAIVAVIAIILVTTFVRIRLADVPLERDEGEYAYTAQVLLKGYWPYENPSTYKYKMPGTYFVYAAILAVFGQTRTAIHLAVALTNLATAALLFLIARKLFGTLAALAASAFFAVLSLTQAVQGLFGHGEHFAIFTTMAGMLLLMQNVPRFSLLRLLIAGFILGTGYIIRQHAAAFIVFATAYLVWQQKKELAAAWKSTVFRTILFLMAAVLPTLLCLLTLKAAGVFDKFWFWNFEYAPKYLRLNSLTSGLKMLFFSLKRIFEYAPIISLLCIAGLFTGVANTRLRPRFAPILLFTVFSFLAICPGFYFRPHYFILILPAISILAALTVCVARKFISQKASGQTTLILTAIAVIAAGAQPLLAERSYFFSQSPLEVSRSTYGLNPFPESISIAKYLKENTSETDKIAILGSEPQILFYADRISATGYTDTYEMMKIHDYAPKMQREMIDEIEAAKPAFIAYVNISTSWLYRKKSETLIFQWFKKAAAGDYERVASVEIASSNYTNYIWQPEPAPRTPCSISIYKRTAKSAN